MAADFDSLLQEFLIDLNGDGIPDVATRDPSIARAAQAAAQPVPLSGRDRRQMQNRAMAGRDPTEAQAARYALDQPRRDAATEGLATVGQMAGTALMPWQASTSLMLADMNAPAPAYGGQPQSRPATDAELQADAAARATQASQEQPLGNRLMQMFKGKDFTPMPYEQFRSARESKSPRPVARDELDYVNAEVDKLRSSDAYQARIERSGPKAAESMVNARREQAKKEYQGYRQRTEAQAGEWDTDIGRQYETYKADQGRAKTEHESKRFAERNPDAANLLTYGPPVLGALAGARAFRQYNKSGADLIKDIDLARKSGNVADELAATKALDTWRNQDYYATIGKTAGKVAGGAIAGRGIMDVTDRYLMPAESGAAKHVKDKYTLDNIGNLAAEYGVNALTGLEAPAIGAMMVRKGPRIEARKYTNALALGFKDEVADFAAMKGAAARASGEAERTALTERGLTAQSRARTQGLESSADDAALDARHTQAANQAGAAHSAAITAELNRRELEALQAGYSPAQSREIAKAWADRRVQEIRGPLKGRDQLPPPARSSNPSNPPAKSVLDTEVDGFMRQAFGDQQFRDGITMAEMPMGAVRKSVTAWLESGPLSKGRPPTRAEVDKATDAAKRWLAGRLSGTNSLIGAGAAIPAGNALIDMYGDY